MAWGNRRGEGVDLGSGCQGYSTKFRDFGALEGSSPKILSEILAGKFWGGLNPTIITEPRILNPRHLGICKQATLTL